MASRGFSLAEVLLALGLAALTLLSLISVLIGGVRLLETSQEVSEATSVGRELMERIKSRADLPANAVFDGRVPDPPQAGGFPPSPYPARQLKHVYQTRVSIRSLDDWRSQVVVEVFWKGKASLQLATVLVR